MINRGNYRSAIFATEGARQSFLKCLDDAATKSGWIVHAWCLMSNHYHLAIETPRANLVDGMRWLQATFATKFNRLRKENGHLFQGRYKSFVVQSEEALGPLCHYIHLNPVRAHVIQVKELRTWRDTSLRELLHPRERRAWYSPQASLDHAGGLRDTPVGRRKYLQYLEWLDEEEPERKRLKFDEMSRGWAIGTKAFKKTLNEDHGELQEAVRRGDKDLDEWREEQHADTLAALLKCLKKTATDIAADPKGTAWKVAIAAEMKRRTTVSNPWLSRHLNMGSPFRVSRLVNASDEAGGETAGLRKRCAMCKV
ncbi:transposase [Synoicihabitans lomoniglobus]|uniref:Transposase n=2 Tax=Synoicihabitans lomoniglobus TaxID=2909285 RepID=A0AAF0I5E0_9BACT|nr:transposase [Opitutaceae bacterium LMO-M01]